MGREENSWIEVVQDRVPPGLCEQGNEPSWSLNVRNFLTGWVLTFKEGAVS